MEQFRGKYLCQNRATGEVFETPQIAFMMIAATLFATYPHKERLSWVKDYYNAISNFDISLPTPVMAGVRTPQRQFSSCVLIETDDNLASINATSSAVVNYVSQKAGIGINAGRIRAVGSPIRNGDTSHTGVTPFLKLFQSSIKSCSQGGVRGGAGTIYYPIWHYEVEDLLVLKNNKGTEENRVRHMDYGVQFNRLFYERLIEGGDITLFSPNDVPGLYDAFFVDYDKFKVLYEKAEKTTKIRKKVIPATELFTIFMQERKDTGRIYLMNVDHANDHGSFKADLAPIRQSNLCAEIALPTIPMATYKTKRSKIDLAYLKDWTNSPSVTNIEIIDQYGSELTCDVTTDESRIALCTLSAVNWGNIKKPQDFEKACTLAIRGLDALLSYQDYPVLAAELHTNEYRPLGVGIINFAYFLAKNNTNYTNPNLELIDEYAEAWSYYLIKASADLAEEKGACELNANTKYSDGILPIDTYKKDVDGLVKRKLTMPWKELKKQLKKTGMRNATVMALMPSETSSQISNATNGIEPPRSFVSIKQSKDGILKQVVPEFRNLKNKYELLWDQKNPEGYIQIMAVLQKYIDQSISANTSYNPAHYEDNKIPMSEMLKHLLMAYKLGLKTLYYFNTNDGQGEIDVTVDLPSEDDETDCDSCVL